MVGRCSDTGGSKEVSEQSEEGTFKLSNAVGGNEIGNAESGKSSVHELIWRWTRQ